MKPKIAVIYLCWNNQPYLSDVVDALAKQTYPKDRTLVYMVPNGSPDNVASEIREKVLPRSEVDLPKIILLDDGVNRGFAGGNNVAVRQALDLECDYVFLHNGDLKLGPEALEKLVDLAESNNKIGSVQSLVLYWDDAQKINVTGGVFHIAGYAYARENLLPLSEMKRENGEEIAYCSGAAVLYRASALQKVGLMEEGFFMYHEDVELGLRLRMAGYINVLCTESRVFHDYAFSRNPKKFAWMELYRWVVVLAYYKILTLIFLFPLLIVIECGTWLMALTGGWVKAKLWQYGELFKPRTWRLLFIMRRRAQRLRVISDRAFLNFVVGDINSQETSSFVMDRIANPVISAFVRIFKTIVVW